MAYKRELIAKTKNLLTEIKPFSNTEVENGIVYQGIADTRELDMLKVQLYNGDTFVKQWSGIAQQIGKNTLTFTTNILPAHTRVIFGLNGITYDTTVYAPITLENNTTYTLSMDFINITQGEIAWTNSMLEKGAAATDYVPYGRLTSYKKLLKVSDVCQLLDKNTFGTLSGSGITATYNNDGTFTVSGAATESRWWNFPVFQLRPRGGEHVYLFDVGGISNDSNCYCNIYFYDEIVDRAVELIQTGSTSSTIIKKLNSPTVYQARFNITTLTGATPNNVIYKPQLFDLTEMYGVGNEPATVDEFRAKFPNDLYDYSPRCWVKSYKTGLIAKTKNLFDINALTPYTPETLPNYTAGIYNGNIIARAGVGSSVCRSGKTLKQLCPDLVAGERYVLSYETNATGGVNNIYLLEEDRAWQNGYSIIITETSLNSIVCFYANYPDFTVATISNFQIEKGSTATDYVPYGYL